MSTNLNLKTAQYAVHHHTLGVVVLQIIGIPFQYGFPKQRKLYHLNIDIVYFFSELVYFFIAKF